MTQPSEEAIRKECEEALAWTVKKCPNAPYVPLKRETTEQIISALAQRIEAVSVAGVLETTPTLQLSRLLDRAAAAEAENAKLRAALEPFAACMEWIADDESDEEWAKFRLLVKDYRRARVALETDNG